MARESAAGARPGRDGLPRRGRGALNLFLRALFAFQRRCARRDGVRDGEPGAVTSVQRFGSALNLNLHVHCVVPDGVLVEPRGAPRDAPLEFHPLRPREDEDVEALLRKTATRVVAMLRKRGRLDTAERANDLDALGARKARRSRARRDDEVDRRVDSLHALADGLASSRCAASRPDREVLPVRLRNQGRTMSSRGEQGRTVSSRQFR